MMSVPSEHMLCPLPPQQILPGKRDAGPPRRPLLFSRLPFYPLVLVLTVRSPPIAPYIGLEVREPIHGAIGGARGIVGAQSRGRDQRLQPLFPHEVRLPATMHRCTRHRGNQTTSADGNIDKCLYFPADLLSMGDRLAGGVPGDGRF